MSKRWQVSEVARLAHVTVRTLHHYDEIGLLVPSDRSDAGYRFYSADDLARLHQILLFRELDFSLEAIRKMLEEPAHGRLEALRDQRELLSERIARAESVAGAVDAAIQALEEGRTMSTESMFSGFEDFDHAQYADEARERWGGTDSYRESMRRVKKYTKQDWAALKAEAESIEADWAALMAAGRRPEEDEVADVAERHRLHMDRWFYPTSPAMHVSVSEMYTADPRFERHYEQRAEGLAAYVAASIRANAARR